MSESSAHAADAARDALGVLRERRFRLFFAGQTVSVLGDGMVGVALAFAVLGLTGSAADLGVVLAARAIPLVAFLLIGGVVADRLSRRTVMLVADVARCVSQGAIAVLLIAGHAEIWSLAALSAVSGMGSAFFDPASTGLMPALVAPQRLQQANALRGMAMAGGSIGGPAIAGVLVAGAGAGWALAVDAATFAVSAACLARLPAVRAERPAHGGFWEDLRDGWREVTRRDWLWSTVVSASLGNGIFAAFGVLGPLVAERSLGGAPAWALISAALGLGSLAGSVVALRMRPGRPLLVGTLAVTLLVLPFAGLALELAPVATAALTLVAGAGLMVFNSLWETALQRHVPEAALSRVSAYDWFGSLALTPLGYAAWGGIGAAAGVVPALWAAAALQAAVTLPLLAVPGVRQLRPAPAG
jgi:MFS family permease